MDNLPRSFFARPTLQVARDLLGQRLVRLLDGRRLSGLIVEVEAYVGERDGACHARSGRTARNAVMYGPPGHAYIYFTYGCHWLLNIVTEREGMPAAVLIRALLPQEGLEIMRRHRRRPDAALADGPAKLTQALAIDGRLNGCDMCAPDAELLVEAAQPIPPRLVRRAPRVGIDYAPEPWRSKRWNFSLASPGTSSET